MDYQFSPVSLLFQLPRPASWNSFWISRTLLRFLCHRCNDFFFVYALGLSFSCLHLFGFVLGSVSMQILFFLGHRKDLTPCQSMRECPKLTFSQNSELIKAAPWGASPDRPTVETDCLNATKNNTKIWCARFLYSSSPPSCGFFSASPLDKSPKFEYRRLAFLLIIGTSVLLHFAARWWVTRWII